MSHTVDVYYSFRSPYCYLLTPRLVALEQAWDAEVLLRPVFPIAVRDAGFFKRIDPLYRPYHLRDSIRLAAQLGIPYRRPVPDPIQQDMKTGEIAHEQPYIRHVTRLAMAATEEGKGLVFADHVMRLLWDGQTDNWHEGANLSNAMTAAGLDATAIDARAREEAEALDRQIETNQASQRAAGHWGVPLMVFENEPFYGQDRFEQLLWRMRQSGVKEK